jgi:hypothetical protein
VLHKDLDEVEGKEVSLWKSWTSNTGDRLPWPEPDEDFSDEIRTFFNGEELLQMELLLKSTLKLSEAAVRAWMDELLLGCDDETMKGLLLALLPHVQWVNYISCALHPS